MQLILSGYLARASCNKSLTTKVNASNLIFVLIIFNRAVTPAEGGSDGRSDEIGPQQEARTDAKLITGLYKFTVMSHFL